MGEYQSRAWETLCDDDLQRFGNTLVGVMKRDWKKNFDWIALRNWEALFVGI